MKQSMSKLKCGVKIPSYCNKQYFDGIGFYVINYVIRMCYYHNNIICKKLWILICYYSVVTFNTII